MVDWGLAVKIACGGFGTVFIILAILCLSIRMTRSVVEKMTGEEPKK
jgi:Na+-transporting methylmalonyl-CoA/oxaloacetate decarboxylase gamma subunit